MFILDELVSIETNSKSLVNVGSKFVCTMCQPNVTFVSAKGRRAHMRNKNIHPDLAAAFLAGELKGDILTLRPEF